VPRFSARSLRSQIGLRFAGIGVPRPVTGFHPAVAAWSDTPGSAVCCLAVERRLRARPDGGVTDGGILFGRTELERAFTVLAERLARRGVVANLLVVGGRRVGPSQTAQASSEASVEGLERLSEGTLQPR
jgi:hypothetical protein